MKRYLNRIQNSKAIPATTHAHATCEGSFARESFGGGCTFGGGCVMPWKYRAVAVPYPKLFEAKLDNESDLYQVQCRICLF